MSSMRLIYSLMETPDVRRLAVLFLLMLLTGFAEGFGALLLIPLLDSIQAGTLPAGEFSRASLFGFSPTPSVNLLFAAFILLITVRGLAQHARDLLSSRLRHQIVNRLRRACLDALLHADWTWIAAQRQSDKADLLLNDIGRVATLLNSGVWFCASLVIVLAYGLAALVVSWKFTVAALIGMLLVLLLARTRVKRMLMLGQDLTHSSRRMQGSVEETLSGIKLAKIYGAESRQLNYLMQASGELLARQADYSRSVSYARSILQFCGAACLVGFLYVGTYFWPTALSELLALMFIFSRLIPLAVSTQQYLFQSLHAFPSLIEVDQLLRESVQHAEHRLSGSLATVPEFQSIRLESVGVRFSGRDRWVLDGVSAEFCANRTTLIVGASGAGKSTLADVLMGLVTPGSGRVLLNGEPLDERKRQEWRHAVAYVPQDVFLFNDTIRSNLLWGGENISEADLVDALRRASADFVLELPEGLDTRVGDRGVHLSGGERQRVALARALLRKPALLILDEATSALDPVNEARVFDALGKLSGTLCVIIIGHRLPELDFVDEKICLDQGRVV